MSVGNTKDIREVECKYCHFRIQELLIVRITICLRLFMLLRWEYWSVLGIVCTVSVLFTIATISLGMLS